ncbi:ATP-binding protein [Thermosediminibacter litoriperuensis]|uniref:histidine kinase n=1 Tax=Thermosediminibacter litoriperuensis TaxID=291989 RepID=A0A5S5AWD8_9FIRM|nr:ATP-binding protein [Thermosediminibacter litoriperuensis]TYP57659.1 histidine kinase/DNA gyrase B/HSP90-like ATPase [Thermosediminibacter litoriperuensis]
MKEISLHVLDIVENSLNAGATVVEIEIVEDSKKDLLAIEIRDNGMGMDEQTVKKALDPFFTSRTTRKVGLGLPLLAQAAKTAGGDVTVHSLPGQGTVVKAWFKKSHIDLQPLGNMADTVASLVAVHPDVDFIYRHVIDGGVYRFDLRQIRRKLQDVPVNNPLVVNWIKKFISDSLKEINGGAE